MGYYLTEGYFIVKNLLESVRQDLMYVMATKEDYPSWGNMLHQGATTLWEAWDGRNSLLHSSYLHIGAWFIEGLAGIRPDPERPDYKHFILKPGVMKEQNLDWVKARLETPYGLIRSEWTIGNETFQLKVSVPPNTTATVYLPTMNSKSIKEGNTPLTRSHAVGHVRNQKGYSIIEIQPGRYSFETDL